MTTEPQIADDVTRPEKKDVQIIKVLVDKAKGTVKWYNVKRLYGFINREDNNEDVFVHRSAITGTSRQKPSLRNGEEVEFSVVETTQGVEAADVTGPDGANVLGFRSRRNRRFGRGGKGAGLDGEKLNNDSGADNENNAAGNEFESSAKGKKRRRPRKNRRSQNGEANGGGTQSEIETYYEAIDADNHENGGSPGVGQQRRAPRPPRNFDNEEGDGRQGDSAGFPGRRGRGRRYFNSSGQTRYNGNAGNGDDLVPGEPRPYSRGGGMSNGLKGRGRGGRRGRGGFRGGYVSNGNHSDGYASHEPQN